MKGNSSLKWWYFIVGFVAHFLAIGLTTVLMSFLQDMASGVTANKGSIFNLIQFLLMGCIALVLFRLISKRKVSREELGFHLGGVKNVITISVLFGVFFFGITEIAELLDEQLRKGSQEVASSLNIGKSFLNDLLLLLNIGLFAPVFEEIVFRGAIFYPLYKGLKNYTNLPKYVPFLLATVGSVFAFLSSHGGGGQDAQLYLLALMSVIACYIYYRTESIYAPILFHAINNIIVFVLIAIKEVGLSFSYGFPLIVLSVLCLLIGVPFSSIFGRFLESDSR